MVALISYFLISLLNPVRPGYAVVQFHQSLRSKLEKNVLSPFDLPEFKEVFTKYGVTSLKRLIVDPKMPEDAKSLGLDLIYLIKFDSSANVFNFVDELREFKDVKYADPDYAKVYFFYPDDPYLHLQWSLSVADAIGAWNITRGDSSIIIGIDDTGVDWRHEDLVDNIYQNLGEDADGDGHVIENISGHWVFDPGDVNGIDDDGNGKVDDFVGWDFYEGNNDPSPAHNGPDYTHGTHVAGIASAVTNNGLGVAGVGFNCKILAIRSHWLSNSVSAVYYATNMGADVFNMSWGGWIGSLGTAFQYAHNHGMVLVAAAGNENTSSPSYPAAHPLVISVAATDQYDRKSSYSNYGRWVDIAAPGDNILSTIPGGGYDSFYGTSMASPFVSGVVGLLRSIAPFYPPDSIKSIILTTADSINDSYYLSGNLGAGRVNAYKAVSLLGRRLLSFVSIQHYSFSDNGDGDGRPDPGETVELRISLTDSTGWQPAEYLRVIARSLVPQVVINDSVSIFGTLQPGDTANNLTDPISFTVVDTASPVTGMIELRFITDSPGPVIGRDTLFFQISQPYVLIVDDDGGTNNEHYYIDALNSININFDYWSVSDQGVPSLSGIYGLGEHNVVIWFTGEESTPFTEEELDTIETAMNAGTNFIISSQNAAQTLRGSSFLRNYFHASYIDSSVSDYFVVGVSGDPISNGMSFVIFGAGGANNANSKDAVLPVNGGISLLTYRSNGNSAGIRYSGAYKLVYLTFPWEAINSSVSGYDSATVLMKNMLRWIGVPVDVDETPVLTTFPISIAGNLVYGKYLFLNTPKNYYRFEAEIFDVTGRKIRDVVPLKVGDKVVINVSDLNNGVYYLKINKSLEKFLILRK